VLPPGPAEPELAVVASATTMMRLVSIPVDQLGEFADRIMLAKCGVEAAPSLAGLSIGPDDDFDSEVGD
jgi:hypothetical protein